MEIEYKRKKRGISINSHDKCDNFVVGDSIICMDDQSTINITKNRTYEALYIYEADCPKSNDQIIFVQIADDGDEICGYEADRFTSISDHREQKFSKMLD